MKIYLDNAATTKCSKTAADVMMRLLTEEYGNPSSLHEMGAYAEACIKEARKKTAKTLKAEEKEIIFTSGGTESNNLAVFGAAEANKRAGNHVITTAVEHASVYQPMKRLEELGYRVTYLPVDADGVIRMEALEEALDEETILVSMIHVNNEIGSVQPVAEAAELIHKKAGSALFHIDAVQSYGKIPLCPKKMGVDLLSVSGHKIHGPKGSGFLYIRDKAKVRPAILGGGQQKGMRSGTENVPAIAGLGEAAVEICGSMKEHAERMHALKTYFVEEAEKIEGVTVNGKTGTDSAPHIISLSVEDVRSEVLLHSLEEKGIYVSAGSACSSNRPSVSRTLQAAGLNSRLLDSTIRLSMCGQTTKEEMDAALYALQEIIPFRRKFTRK